MLSPHAVVRDAARIARTLADQATRRGSVGCAVVFARVAVETDHRADRLRLLWRRSSPRDDGLSAWIENLRVGLDRGDLARLPPIDFGDGVPALPAERTVEIMLADLDGFEGMDPDEIAHPLNVARYRGLLDDFHRLRFLMR